MKKDEASAKIAELITAARERNGWTRYELAKNSGISIGHLSRIERGNIAVRVDILNRLTLALNLVISFPL